MKRRPGSLGVEAPGTDSPGVRVSCMAKSWRPRARGVPATSCSKASSLRRSRTSVGRLMSIAATSSTWRCATPLRGSRACSQRLYAAKFASLTTVVLTGCESVDGAHIVDLMREIGMTSRPKKDRLRRLHLAGCQVDDYEVATLSECVRLGRLENYAACFREPHKEQDGIDVCVCLNCDDVMPMSKTYMCYSCLDTCCVDIAEEIWGPTCGGCPANVCGKDQCAVSLLWYDCVSCNEDFCGDCESSGKITVCRGSGANPGCFESVCHTCDANTFYIDCVVCYGRWCDECWHAFDGLICYGEHGGCDATVCGA